MRGLFAAQGVKGVVIACQDCGSNHFYEWELLQDNLEHMLETGEPRMHEPAFDIQEEEYIQWDYGKGYIDALADTGLEPDRTHRGRLLPVVPDAVRGALPLLSAVRRSLGAVRLYHELVAQGMEEREVRALLVRAGYEPF